VTPDSRQVAEEVPEGEAPQGTTVPATIIPWQQRPREDVIAEILARHEDGEPLLAICRSEGMPSRALIHKWQAQDPALRERFAHARAQWRGAIEDECVDLSDSATPANVDVVKLRIWTRLQLIDRADSVIKANPNKGKQLPPTIQIVGIEPKRIAAPAPAVEPEEAAEPDNPDGLVL
jgi:hypothetical protein